jgi:4-aminobutyrate aminotransferase-like enzyme
LLECPREKRVEQLGALDAVTDVRGYGVLAGVDIRTDGKPGQAGDRMVAMVEDVLREF